MGSVTRRKRGKPTAGLQDVGGDIAAAAIDLSRSRFGALVQAGILPKPTKRGAYNLPAVVAAYVEYVNGDKEASTDVREAKRRFWAARARREQLEVACREGDLIELTTAEEAMRDMLLEAVTVAKAWPGRLATELAGISDPALIRHRLLEEVRDFLATLREKADALARDGATRSGANAAGSSPPVEQ